MGVSIATVVLYAMKQKGVTQKELADSIGVTQSYISQICSGRKIPTLKTLTRIGGYLGIPMTQFVMDDRCQSEENILEITNLNADEIRILSCYRRMNERDQGLIRVMADRIVDRTG